MNIVIISHGSLCEGIVESCSMIAGNHDVLHTVKLDDNGIQDFTNRLHDKVETLLEKGEVIIYADMKGGTPFNEAYKLYIQKPDVIRVVSGVNLPMVMETVLALEQHTLDSIYELAVQCGKNSIEGVNIEENIENDITF